MTSIINLPVQLIHFLKEHLTPEDLRIIADDYGERNGQEESLYDQLVDRAGVQQVVRVLVLHAIARKDIMSLVHLITEHYPALQEELYALGFEITALIRSYLVALQQEIRDAEKQEVQPETLRYFIRQTGTPLPIQQDQPLDFTSLLSSLSETAQQAVLTEVDLDDLLSTHQYVILSHSERATTVSVLRSLALRMIEDWQHAPADAAIPVLVPLEKWFNPILDLYQFLQMHMIWLGIPQFAEVLADLLHTGKVVLLLEGLDCLPFAKYNELTGLLEDTRVLSIIQLSKECQWRTARCVLSCQVKNFLFGPQWHEVQVLDPDREQQLRLSDNPALTLKNHVDSVFERADASDQLLGSVAASELQTCLGRLALNITYFEHSLRNKRSLSNNEPVRIDIQTAAVWLFHVQELNDLEMKPQSEELQLAEQLFHRAEVFGLLARGSVRLSFSSEPGIYFPDEHIKSYLCLHYCLAHMQEDPWLVGRLLSGFVHKVWWLWRAYNPDLIDKLLLLLRSSDQEAAISKGRLKVNKTKIKKYIRLMKRKSGRYPWGGRSRSSDKETAISKDRLKVNKTKIKNHIRSMKRKSRYHLWKGKRPNRNTVETRSNAIRALSYCGDSRAVEPLIALCNDTDALIRGDAALALGSLRDQRAIEPLLNLLKDVDANVRWRALVALSNFDDQRITIPLTHALKDENQQIRFNAATLLRDKQDTRAIPALISALSDEWGVAKDALVKLGKAAVPALMATLARTTDSFAKQDYNPYFSEKEKDRTRMAYYTVETLGNIGDTRPLPMLIWMEEHDHREIGIGKVRQATERAIREIQEHHGLAAPLLAALHHRESSVRIGAVFALGLLGDSRAVEPLITALQDRHAWMRYGAAQLLGNLGDQRAIVPLIATMHDIEYEVSQSASAALRKFGAPIVAFLIPLLEDTDSSVRLATARLLGEIRSKEAVEPLIAALSDPNNMLRRAAVIALGNIGDKRALEPLLAAARDPSIEVRKSVGEAVNKIDPEQSIHILITALQDPNGDIRQSAARDLIQYGDSRAVEPLIAALKDPYDNVREYASYALKRHGDSRVVEPLIELVQNETGLDARAAAGALAALGDQRAIVPIVAILAKSEQDYCASLAGALLSFGEAITQPLINALEDQGPNDPIYSQEFWQHSFWDMGHEYFRENRHLHYYRANLHYYAADLLGNVGDVRALPVLMWMEAKDYSITREEKRAREGGALWQELMQQSGIAVDSMTRKEKSARVAAAQAIQNILQRNPSPDTLAASLNTQDESVRLGAAFALGNYHDQRAIPMLIDALKHGDRHIRWGAAHLLDGFGGYRKIAPLIAALEDEDNCTSK